jgi:type IV secretion system protein TrbL
MNAQILNDITSAFVNALEAGTRTLGQVSLPLLALCAVLGFYLQLGPQLASGGVGLSDALGNFLLQVLKIGIFYWLLFRLPDLTDAAFRTFVQWGAAAGGDFTAGQFLNPAVVADMGFRLARPIRTFTDSLVKWMAVWDWPTLFIYSLSYYLIVTSFMLIALHLMMTIIEFHLAVMAGTVLIPWGVLQPTAFFTEFSLGWITGGLVRVLVTAALIGIATPLFTQVRFTASSGGDPTFYSAVLCGLTSGVFAILAWVIPTRAAAMAGRGVSLALNASTLVAGAATGARVAVFATGGVGRAVQGVSTLVQAARAGYRRQP